MLIDNISTLVTNDPELGTLRDAALLFEDGVVPGRGRAPRSPRRRGASASTPAAARSSPASSTRHGHLVFAGDRAEEFAARMAGRAYSAGGIKTTVAATRAASDDALGANVDRLVAEALRSGTTTVETKSGYGLTVHDERRQLRVATPRTDERTFLGAHVVPPEYEADAYVDLVKGEMLDACAPHARWIDVFCEDGAFDGEQTRAILEAGIAKGLVAARARQPAAARPGGPDRGRTRRGVRRPRHPRHRRGRRRAGRTATPSPRCSPARSSRPARTYPDARRLLDAGVTVALAADCNPGSSYTTNIPFCIAIAVREMHMTPDEAVWAATAGGARALRRTDIGHLGVGARADAVLLDAPSHIHLAYRPGVPLVAAVWRTGVRA